MSWIVALLGAGVYGALWLLAPVALALEPTLPSSVIVVSQDGSGAYQEIQRAIDEAKPGDTIFIKAGSYREDVVVHSKNHLRLVGEARDHVTIHGLKRVGAFRVGKWPYGANDIEIRDLTISENGGLAVGVFNGSRILLFNIRVLGLLYVQQATGVRIEHSLIAQSETTGVSFADAEGELTENDIRNNDYGVTISGKSSVRFTGNLIQDNVVAGVVLQGGAKGELVRNTIVNMNQAGGYAPCFPLFAGEPRAKRLRSGPPCSQVRLGTSTSPVPESNGNPPGSDARDATAPSVNCATPPVYVLGGSDTAENAKTGSLSSRCNRAAAARRRLSGTSGSRRPRAAWPAPPCPRRRPTGR